MDSAWNPKTNSSSFFLTADEGEIEEEIIEVDDEPELSGEVEEVRQRADDSEDKSYSYTSSDEVRDETPDTQTNSNDILSTAYC